MLFKRVLFLITFLAITLHTTFLHSQERRILVVPFDQFQFDSPVPIEEIAQFNGLKSTEEVYPTYNDSILSQMNRFAVLTTYFMPDEADIQNLRNSLPRVYKREPVSHFGVDIQPLLEEGKLSEFMNNMGADYLMFITRYKITGKLISTRKGIDSPGGFITWTSHFIDYEIYNKEGELVSGADRFPFTPLTPRSSNHDTKGTKTADLYKASEKLDLNIKYNLDKYEKNGKVSFKAKKR